MKTWCFCGFWDTFDDDIKKHRITQHEKAKFKTLIYGTNNKQESYYEVKLNDYVVACKKYSPKKYSFVAVGKCKKESKKELKSDLSIDWKEFCEPIPWEKIRDNLKLIETERPNNFPFKGKDLTSFSTDYLAKISHELFYAIIGYSEENETILHTPVRISFGENEMISSDVVATQDEITEFKEGKRVLSFVNRFERSLKARKKCVEKFGAICFVCKFDFSKEYGTIGIGFIEVHHLKELSSIRKEYTIDSELDLRPVCSNCHSMLHRRIPAYSIEDMVRIIENNNN